MLINGTPYRTIWLDSDDPKIVQIIDQRVLPHRFEITALRTVDDAIEAISDMAVRGAPLIGATGAFGLYLAAVNNDDLDLAAHQFAELCKSVIFPRMVFGVQSEFTQAEIDRVINGAVDMFMARYGVSGR